MPDLIETSYKSNTKVCNYCGALIKGGASLSETQGQGMPMIGRHLASGIRYV